MVEWKLVFTNQAQKDAKKIKSANLKNKVEDLLVILENNPFQIHPFFEKLTGDLIGTFFRRINIQHRSVYHIYEDIKSVKIIRMWAHYE